jgi:tetrahydromethanopterin S-methyltransferase subunit D
MGGIGAAVGGFAGALLFESAGAQGMYLILFFFVTLVLVSANLIRRALPPELERIPLSQ